MDITNKIDRLLGEGDVGNWWYEPSSDSYYQVDNNVQMEILLSGLKGKSRDKSLNGKVRLQFRDFKDGGFIKSIDFVPPSTKVRDIIKYVDKNLRKLTAKAKKGVPLTWNESNTLDEKASPYALMKAEIERQLKNRPKQDQLDILNRYWVEMSKNKKSKWWEMNPTEKKSLTNWFNKVTSAVEAGKNPFGL